MTLSERMSASRLRATTQPPTAPPAPAAPGAPGPAAPAGAMSNEEIRKLKQ